MEYFMLYPIFTTVQVRRIWGAELGRAKNSLTHNPIKQAMAGAEYTVTRAYTYPWNVGNKKSGKIKRGFAYHLSVEGANKRPEDDDNTRVTLITHDDFAKHVVYNGKRLAFRKPLGAAEVTNGPSNHVYVAYRGRRGQCEIFCMSKEHFSRVVRTTEQSRSYKAIQMPRLPTAINADAPQPTSSPRTDRTLKTSAVECLTLSVL